MIWRSNIHLILKLLINRISIYYNKKDMPCTLTGESYANMVGAVIDSVAFTASEMDDVFYNTANKRVQALSEFQSPPDEIPARSDFAF